MIHLPPARLEPSTDDGIGDALTRLQFAGFEVIPHSKSGASQASVDELLDICTTRGLLEEQAARLAVRNLTSKDVDALERIAASLASAVADEQPDDIVALHRQLHFTIYRAAKRRHLLRLIEELWELSARYADPFSHSVSVERSDELQVVRAIVSACKLKDANAMGMMIRYKVHQDSARLLERARSR